MIAGEKRWITASSMQEFADKVAKLLSTPQSAGRHPFGDYAWNWFHTYSKPNIETVTATTYERQIRLYLIPAFDGMNVEEITPMTCSGYSIICQEQRRPRTRQKSC